MDWVDAPGSFYIGEVLEKASQHGSGRPVLLDASDLTTHAVVLGMTGSGKTGLCIDILEEAALDGIPVIAVDIKGDITNLFLTFPQLRVEDFIPWVDPGTSDTPEKRKNIARITCERWQNGLRQWGIPVERIARLRNTAVFSLYTPGASTIFPLSVLRNFQAPKIDWDKWADLIRMRISTSVSALLSLLGMDSDPLTSREHILLSNLVEQSWQKGYDLTIEDLIRGIQRPPFQQLGVFDLETFFPAQERMKLALAFNGLLASPSFNRWLSGPAMDIDQLWWNRDGKPRLSVLYIAHLSPAEKDFFLTIFLQSLLEWMVRQPGTEELKAILYIDEIMGLIPPVKESPPKSLLLTFLKQARAFGLGLVLATQNPVDLDYKGLSNSGFWAIGHLQTERDLARLHEGLQDLSSGEDLTPIIAHLEKRNFLIHNVHDPSGPFIMKSRWAMSYLRGPLTLHDLQRLDFNIAPRGNESAHQGLPHPPSSPEQLRADRALPPVHADIMMQFPTVPTQGSLKPKLFCELHVLISDSRSGLNLAREFILYMDPPEDPRLLPSVIPSPGILDPKAWTLSPLESATYATLPSPWLVPGAFKILERWVVKWVAQNMIIPIPYHSGFKILGKPGQSLESFYSVLNAEIRKRIQQETDNVSKKYQKQMDSILRKLHQEESKAMQYQTRIQSLKTERAANITETVLGFLLGRRSTRLASSYLVKQRMLDNARLNAEKSKEEIEQLNQTLLDLKNNLDEELRKIKDMYEGTLHTVEIKKIKLRRKDIEIIRSGILWVTQETLPPCTGIEPLCVINNL